MAAPLENCTGEERRSVIRVLRSEGVKPIEIHRRMKVQYGDACLSQQRVYEWSRKFANGVTSGEDAPRPHQAQQLQQSQTCILSVFLIHHTQQTLPQVISICLDHSKKQWEERSSVQMKTYATQCMSGCTDYQKKFFLKEFMHIVSAGGIALSVGEIMLKSNTALHHFCIINSI